MSNQPYFYYLRDRDKRPLVTVCLLRDTEGKLCRGISLCHPNDMPSKKKGRAKAAGRAKKASAHKTAVNSKLTGPGAIVLLGITYNTGLREQIYDVSEKKVASAETLRRPKLGMYDAQPVPFEEKLLKIVEKIDEA